MGQIDGDQDGHNDPHTLTYDPQEEVEGMLESKRERKFLFKLDACLMTWAWLAYLIKVR